MSTYEQWEGEPNYITGNFYGLDCAIIRNHFGSLCGYVAVKPGHPLYGIRYGSDNTLINSIDVHGGLTYSEYYLPIISALDDGTKWWFGFDCGHFNDLIPILNEQFKIHFGKEMPGCYRDMEYVKGQVELLAFQLAEIPNKKIKHRSPLIGNDLKPKEL